MSPDEAFARDVPTERQEDVLTILSEAAQGIDHPDVHILERDRIDAINVRAHGILQFGGEEFTFQIQDGNWNGTELLAWNDDRPFELHEPTRWTLEPNGELVEKAITEGRGPFLIFKWDAMLSRAPVSEIAGKYAYDRRVQPGVVVESHWKAEAARFGFVIVTEDQAAETRARLELATSPYDAP